MDRRSFIKYALATSAMAALTNCGRRNENSDKSVVVIGAGMAGIAAARTLHDAGFMVTVLEGRSRIGGRIFTSREWPDTPLDMGASWIHGVTDNPLTALADKISAPRLTTDYESGVLYDADGRLQPGRIWEQIGEFEATVNRAMRQAPAGASIAEASAEKLDLQTLTDRQKRLYDFAVNNGIEQEYAADISELSAEFTYEGEAFGGDDVIFPEGYDRLIEHLAADLDIRPNETVSSISYTETGVSVETTSGLISADYAIVTLPIGVLKHQSVTFNPPLPDNKLAAIDALGVGVLNKVYMRFPEPFWQKMPHWLSFISERKGEWTTWLNMYHYLDKPILVAFNAGEFGRKVETFSDEEIAAQAFMTLKTMYGDDIPSPDSVQITRWHSDPFARCSYSSAGVDMHANTRSDLAQPVGNRLFFAGEATHSDNPSTVHGAYLSGLREAERLIDKQ